MQPPPNKEQPHIMQPPNKDQPHIMWLPRHQCDSRPRSRSRPPRDSPQEVGDEDDPDYGPALAPIKRRTDPYASPSVESNTKAAKALAAKAAATAALASTVSTPQAPEEDLLLSDL